MSKVSVRWCVFLFSLVAVVAVALAGCAERRAGPVAQSAAPERYTPDNCWGRSASYCLEVGQWYEFAKFGKPQDYVMAARLYAAACERGNLRGCMNLGSIQSFSVPAVEDQAASVANLEKACAGGIGHACYWLAQGLVKLDDSPAGLVKVLATYRRACDRGYAHGCGRFARWQAGGWAGEPDFAEAIPAYELSCGEDDAFGCVDLGILYETGRGVATDLAKAAEYYRRSCEAKGPNVYPAAPSSANACTYLGGMYRAGRGMPHDDRLANAYLALGCDGGDPIGCSALGGQYYFARGVAQDLQKAAALWITACDADVANACFNLGTVYWILDSRAARKLYVKACALGEQAGCQEAKR